MTTRELQISIELSEQELAELDTASKLSGETRQEFIQTAIRKRLDTAAEIQKKIMPIYEARVRKAKLCVEIAVQQGLKTDDELKLRVLELMDHSTEQLEAMLSALPQN